MQRHIILPPALQSAVWIVFSFSKFLKPSLLKTSILVLLSPSNITWSYFGLLATDVAPWPYTPLTYNQERNGYFDLMGLLWNPLPLILPSAKGKNIFKPTQKPSMGFFKLFFFFLCTVCTPTTAVPRTRGGSIALKCKEWQTVQD